jgi:hypothetical protein
MAYLTCSSDDLRVPLRAMRRFLFTTACVRGEVAGHAQREAGPISRPAIGSRSMQQVACCDAIDVGKTSSRVRLWVETCEKFEQALVGAVCNRDR